MKPFLTSSSFLALTIVLSNPLTHVAACAVLGDRCKPGADAMFACNSGVLVMCMNMARLHRVDMHPNESVSTVKWMWITKHFCRVPSDGSLQCVEGKCNEW